MTYKIYENQLDLIMKNSKSRRNITKHFNKKSISYDEFVDSVTDDILDGELINLFAREKHWVDTGSPTIFIENEELANQLYSASFDIKNFNVDPPFETFALSFPKGTVIEGIALNTVLVSIMTIAKGIKASQDMLGIPPEGHPLESSGELCVCLCINHGIIVSSGHLYLSSYEDPILKSHNGQTVTKSEVLTKIALSLCVYHSATEGKKLEKGYPKSWVKKSNITKKANCRAMVLRDMGSDSKLKNKMTFENRKITLKVPFFRNL